MEVVKRKFWAWLRGFAWLNLALLLSFGAVIAPVDEASASSSIKAAIIVDANTNQILYSRSADELRAPASLTKIMTLYVLFAYLRAGKLTFDTDLVVTPHAAAQAPTKLGLKPGSTIKVIDAIKGLVTKSANDAAACIGENLGGTEANFARMMTQTAHNLGMKNTTFKNASGLPAEGQLTTARDLAILAIHIMHDYPEYYGFFETRYFTYKGRRYRNHNRLLFGYKGTDGIKTGYTRASGFNLTASVKRGDKHLVGVVLGGRTGAQRDAAMRALLDKHWAKASTGKSTGSDRRGLRLVLAATAGSETAPLRPCRGDALTRHALVFLGNPHGRRRHQRPRRHRAGKPLAEPAHAPRERQQAPLCRHLPRPGGRLYLRERRPKSSRHGSAARLETAQRAHALHGHVHQRRYGMVPGALRRLLQGRRPGDLRGPEADVARLHRHVGRIAQRPLPASV